MSSTIKAGWNHPVDESDQWDGFNEPGIEHFAGNPIRHLAREVNQNSLDSSDGGAPVRVHMRLSSIDVESIPNCDQLRKTFELCHTAAETESLKARQFFSNALDELAKPKISVLDISDFNTRGMRGPAQNGTPYYSFMKAKGQSKKDSSTATGSFGIGKFAPYAVSKLRTVFVSTVYEDTDGEFQQLTQGKSILMSHDDGSKRRQGAGFWGIRNKCQPLSGFHSELPNWLQRSKTEKSLSKSKGTRLAILGFDTANGWRENLAASVAENFFGAIYKGSLEVDVDGKFKLNADSIPEFLANKEIKETISKQKNEPEQFDNCGYYLEALSDSAEVTIEESEVIHLGLCEIRILLKEGLPKRVCFLRNGMFISDSLQLPGLKNFSDFKEFVAVVECKTKKGVELLRSMEPPRHDDFEYERLTTKEEQAKGALALRKLAEWIRNMLKRHAKSPVSETTTLDELKEYFADDSGEESGKGIGETDPSGKIIVRAKRLKPKAYASNEGGQTWGTESSDTGPDEGDEALGEARGVGKDTPIGGAEGTADASKKVGAVVGLSNVRAVIKSPGTRTIFLTPSSSGKLLLSILEAGADSDYSLGVIKSSRGTVQEGKISLPVKAKERVELEVILSEDFDGAIKVVANEI